MLHSALYRLYNCNVVFWFNLSVLNVLSKTCHSTEIFGQSSSVLVGPKTLALAEHYKGRFGAPLQSRIVECLAWLQLTTKPR